MERRGAKRFPFPERVSGTLRILHDVAVEPPAAGEVTLVARVPIPRGEFLLLQLLDEREQRTDFHVRAVECRAAIDEGRINYRARLQLRHRFTPSPEARQRRADGRPAARTKPLPRARTALLVGALIRRIPIRVRNVSLSGCLVESPAFVEPGMVGIVEVSLGGRRHAEPVRIRRSEQRRDGLWPYQSGGELLPFAVPSATSLRRVIVGWLADERPSVCP